MRLTQYLRVFLRSSVGELELSTRSEPEAPYRLLDGVRGLGLPTRELESSPIAAGDGSVLRAQRFGETEVFLPISVRGGNPSQIAEKMRILERVMTPGSNDPIELVVMAPELGTVRRRYVYYEEGMEGEHGGSASHVTWSHRGLKFRALDPWWYGEERTEIRRVSAGKKPFLSGAAPIRQRWNLVLNPNLQASANLAHFSSSQSLVSLVTGDQAKFGQASRSYRITETGSSTRNGIEAYLSLAPLKANTLHAMSLWVFPGEGVNRIGLNLSRQTDGTWYRVGTRQFFPVTPGVWQRIEAKQPVLTSSTVARFEWQALGDAYLPVGSKTYIDGAMVVPGDTTGEYFDGNSPDANELVYAWEGAENASASSETREFSSVSIPFFPVVLADTTVQGSYQLLVEGDGPAYARWTITGPGEDLLIQSVDTGERIFITGTFTEPVTIDTRPTVQDIYSESSDSGELWSRVSLDSVLFPLKPGVNNVRMSLVKGNPQSEVRLTYSERWMAAF